MDFTDQAYKALLEKASERFQFIRLPVDLSAEQENIALWRHDVDFSPQRALALAFLEAELGVIATYYVQLSSRYYSVFEPEVATVFRQIKMLGHDIGLHFDPEVLAHKNEADFEDRIAFEGKVLEEVLETQVRSFTLHNPTTMVGIKLDSLMHGGLLNGSASVIRDHFEYCSDSNGIWRFRKLHEVVKDQNVKRLYALTHPEWWQPVGKPPRASLQRCIDGRAKFCADYYDDLLEFCDRPNIGVSG